MKLKFIIENDVIGESVGEPIYYPNWHEIVKQETVPSNSNIFTNYKLTLKNGSYILLSVTTVLPYVVGKTAYFSNDGIEIK